MSSPDSMIANSEKEVDFYEILGVEKTAPESEIKNAYRRLAIKCHPDKNPGDADAAEKFKKISIAYAVLSDPNKRHQYDRSRALGTGPGMFMADFEGLDMDQVGGLGRMFGALFSKLGVPIPTQLTPKVLSRAQALVRGDANVEDDPNYNCQPAQLKSGSYLESRVERQVAHFFWLNVNDEMERNGTVLLCRSASMSKFKLVLFDTRGNVRLIVDSVKRKNYTAAEMFFVPFDRMELSELFPIRFYQEDKEVPLPFYSLHGLEAAANLRLNAGCHLLAVYGDNWFQDVKYTLRVLTAPCKGSTPEQQIRDNERTLSAKKSSMTQFQTEFMAAKKKYEEVCQRLEAETEEIRSTLNAREAAYEQYINLASEPYAHQSIAKHSPTRVRPKTATLADSANSSEPSGVTLGGLFSNLFGGGSK